MFEVSVTFPMSDLFILRQVIRKLGTHLHGLMHYITNVMYVHYT